MPTTMQVTSSRKITGSVPGLSSADFDVQPFLSFSATKYIIEAIKPDITNFQALELMGARILNNVKQQVYAKFPDGLKIGVNLLVVGSDVVLRITNNEAFSVDVSIVKSKT